jgi:hypothetical protein
VPIDGVCCPFLLLQDKQDNITSPACEEEVFYYQLMEVTDFRNDVILAEACRGDVDKYCKDVEPGAWLRGPGGYLAPPLSLCCCVGLIHVYRRGLQGGRGQVLQGRGARCVAACAAVDPAPPMLHVLSACVGVRAACTTYEHRFTWHACCAVRGSARALHSCLMCASHVLARASCTRSCATNTNRLLPVCAHVCIAC